MLPAHWVHAHTYCAFSTGRQKGLSAATQPIAEQNITFLFQQKNFQKRNESLSSPDLEKG